MLRFVDRDMVMRYHWGLAAGHVYAHRTRDQTVALGTTTLENENMVGDAELNHRPGNSGSITDMPEHEDEVQDFDDPELGFADQEEDFFDDGVVSDKEESMTDDEELIAMDSMYPSN